MCVVGLAQIALNALYNIAHFKLPGRGFPHYPLGSELGQYGSPLLAGLSTGSIRLLVDLSEGVPYAGNAARDDTYSQSTREL